jgi:hypothetical protein
MEKTTRWKREKIVVGTIKEKKMKKIILCFILFIALVALAACETTGGSQHKDSFRPPSGVGVYQGPNGA